MESLVGLRAVDITRLLGENGSFEIGSYNKAICTVLPPIENVYDVIDAFYNLTKRIGDSGYTIIRKPTTRRELVEAFKELEKEVQNGE